MDALIEWQGTPTGDPKKEELLNRASSLVRVARAVSLCTVGLHE
jgi:hypothetical protein